MIEFGLFSAISCLMGLGLASAIERLQGSCIWDEAPDATGSGHEAPDQRMSRPRV